jgi:hypothetical protein
MDTQTYNLCIDLLYEGQLETLAETLAPHLKAGDKDARYLHLLFTTTESAVDFDIRRKRELEQLCELQHLNALKDMAWMHRHGDDGVEQSDLKFLQLMTAAALMGDDDALKAVKIYLAAQMEWDRFPLPPENQTPPRDQSPSGIFID